MKSHTTLLNQLIDALYAAPLSPEIHPYQILAAEIRGQMGVVVEDAPKPDDDGWVENTGKNPYGKIEKVKFRHGGIFPNNPGYRWEIIGDNSDITHYKPL